jgi:hypothetical protein
MMGGATFILLKASQNRPESAKQAERRLAALLKILWIGRPGHPKALAKGGEKCSKAAPAPIFRRNG